MGIRSAAIYSDADEQYPFVFQADEAHPLGGQTVGESYLQVNRIVEIAKSIGADAIHPGYGLLSENPAFVTACEAAGLTFIGPGAEAMKVMGSKIQSRKAMAEAGVPTVPGSFEKIEGLESAVTLADQIGYPVAVKASAAGGGKGFRVAFSPDDLELAIAGAAGEGERFFGDGSVYIERYLENPRHIEVQILGDGFGNVVHLYERDCSIQRRHQKLIEEAPATNITEELRAKIGEVAVKAAESVNYQSAGTVEGLLVGDSYYFLEMNTRIQVEHGVTELVTGIDIVEEQILIAAGHRLRFRQEDIKLRGHAIECRINAERASRGFLPSPGKITFYEEPTGEGIRVDSGVEAGTEISMFYDPMISKLMAHASTRSEATNLMLRALRDYQVEGVPTLIPFFIELLQSNQWVKGETCADLLNDKRWLKSIAETR